MTYILVKSTSTFEAGELGIRRVLVRSRAALVIAIGFMILGVILMFWRWVNHREFFQRRLEVADPAVLDA